MHLHLASAALLLATAPAVAQVSIDAHGVRNGGVTIDSTGVRSGATSITRTGVHGGGGGRRRGITIDANHGNRAVDCGGGALTVNGNHNRLRVGNCAAVSVAGNWNDMTVAFGEPGRLTLAGNRNAVTWRAPRGVRVGVSNVGTRNAVTHAAR